MGVQYRAKIHLAATRCPNSDHVHRMMYNLEYRVRCRVRERAGPTRGALLVNQELSHWHIAAP
ncbi:hypothetical protein M378DRAFT_813125 [Amanita muscaria Koide BX008]|uniref:Uncharacterized protein n=1 Tax=Amanita muscaria (strain Koide BX008) TaxID=946122 RepID=A0A0C2WZQ0_AMAMK|nr:hypothetical protein M378DRAFT_813125 [Amanita muscaria Koide BX008]